MANESNEKNALKAVEDNLTCSSTFDWTVNPLDAALCKLIAGKSVVVKSDVLRTWWHELWQIELNITCKEDNDVTAYEPEITLKNLAETKSDFKSAYNFCITIVEGTQNQIVIHSGSELSSNLRDQAIMGLFCKTLKLCVKIDFFPFKSGLEFCPMAFNFRKKLAALQELELEHMFDFEIQVHGETLETNRIVLALVSPVLFSGIGDCDNKSLEINDADVSTIRMFLDFAHTGQNPNFENVESALKLFYVANNYKVPILKKMCLTYIRSKTISEDNFDEMLMSLNINSVIIKVT